MIAAIQLVTGIRLRH